MQLTNNGKARIFRMNIHDCETLEAKALWSAMYKAQKKEDLAKRGQRLAHGAKHRDRIAPKWELDRRLRIEVQGVTEKDGKSKPGRTNIPDEFYPFLQKILVGEIEIGMMSLAAPVVAPIVEPVVAPIVEPVKPSKRATFAERYDKKDE
jgi:hypothetical protein